MTSFSEQQLYTVFLPLKSWQDRYRKIIELAKLLPPLPDKARCIENQIQGCENYVWLTVEKNNQNKLIFHADSEGRIIKGLIAILLSLANGKTASQIAEINFLAILKQLNIIDELSESRQFGVQNIIQKINQLALSSQY